MLNLSKGDSLYNYGMKVLCYSELSNADNGQEWFWGGTDIAYYKNNYWKDNRGGYSKNYYTFTFTYKFKHSNDKVFFAYSMPYTYSDLCKDLKWYEALEKDYIHRNTLCRTLAGNKCEYLVITSKSKSKKDVKKGVVITARVHPGESIASWMMRGVLDFLTGDSPEAVILWDMFVFKVVPMLNPDGVINGNYRCSLCGGDLNRRYKAPSKVLHPTVYALKRLCNEFQEERELSLFVDLHGHSRWKNIFMYGNHLNTDWVGTWIFPFIMGKLLDYFSYNYSRFNYSRAKEATARISLYKELKIPNVFTMEASFLGPDTG